MNQPFIFLFVSLRSSDLFMLWKVLMPM